LVANKDKIDHVFLIDCRKKLLITHLLINSSSGTIIRIDMERKDILIKGWDFAYDIEGWFPPLKDALSDVDGAEADWRAAGRASNTIRELVNHLLYYKKRFLFRLEDKPWPYEVATNEETFFQDSHASNFSWAKLVEELALVHQRIRDNIAKQTDAELNRMLPDKAVDEQILTLLTHDAYHTGQIVFIRKLYGSWPGVRAV
jgi:uncharacterized damage-inducible protein DinB